MTNDKTVTMSRELAKMLERNLVWGDEAFKAQQEIRALLAAPVVESQPDAYMTVHPNGMKGLFFPSENIEPSPYDKPLYVSPPAPVVVVLPERIEPPSDYAYRKGWNACLDKVKELNQ
ncbi:hypothetical protein [Pseudomonas moorei]|uniref:Uncharacterized protein n=1 Tax=Pseudomonas moorei TaxID=395599 RepID=A0A1H1FL72_9PSED|nr:hypothetical protein [Pseudomonas moorei]KAB0509631.1 hypothetical protein F7R06_01020 [Pseudomonas moorei]SDR01782.1 hypothetical protein SAMN04490195_2769 [Pseudomonas moorei]